LELGVHGVAWSCSSRPATQIPSEHIGHPHNVNRSTLQAQTTEGFSTMDTAALPPVSKLLLMVAMVIGGGVGSTAGVGTIVF
jgi:hypothetical protein